MGSRYLFIVLYVFLEHHLSRGDYRDAVGRDVSAPVVSCRPEKTITSSLPVTDDVQEIYAHRFDDADAAAKDVIWREIAAYLQRFVPTDATVVDIA